MIRSGLSTRNIYKNKKDHQQTIRSDEVKLNWNKNAVQPFWRVQSGENGTTYGGTADVRQQCYEIDYCTTGFSPRKDTVEDADHKYRVAKGNGKFKM
ncbi:hypothetical protein RB195_016112 [Necator americanus]|uniref:Uncharacterized protein n=1 Tax=Necator americanus TaxID=51031 RepID=A0ABR1E7R6_NECAM